MNMIQKQMKMFFVAHNQRKMFFGAKALGSVRGAFVRGALGSQRCLRAAHIPPETVRAHIEDVP